MSNFSALPQAVQGIYITNIELFLKLAIVFILVYLSYRVISTFGEQKKTPYIFVAWLRVIAYGASLSVLVVMPVISLFIFYPEFDFWTIARLLMIIYIVAIVLCGFVIMFNVMYWPARLLTSYGGYSMDEAQDNQVINDIKKFGDNVSFSGKKLINRLRK